MTASFANSATVHGSGPGRNRRPIVERCIPINFASRR